jgi:hypothetical protein
MGVVYHLRSHVTAKAWNNYFPRFLFYFKIRLLFIEYRFKNKKRKNPSPGYTPMYCMRCTPMYEVHAHI